MAASDRRGEHSRNTLVDDITPRLPSAAAVCQFARRLDVIVWAPERLPD
jgi:hypothetical protein